MLDKIEAHKYVAQNAKHVKINYDKLNIFADNLNIQNNIHWLKDIPFGMNKLTTEQMVNFLLIYHAIGFSYWGNPKWTVEYENKKYDGAYGLICAFAKEIKKNNNFFNFKYLSNLTYEEFKKILEGNIEIPLLQERYNIIIEISKTVNEKMNSNFYSYIKDINKDKELLDVIIQNFKSFEDVSKYKNKEVCYYKRAQLLVSDILHINEDKENLQVDYNNLIGCADYKIPQVLRDLEITEYDAELSNLVDNEIPIKENTEYEIEIRSTMLVVIEKIKERLDNKYNSIQINDYIWIEGQNKENIKRPYHRTRTTAY